MPLEFNINCPYCAKTLVLRISVGVLIVEPGKTKQKEVRRRGKRERIQSSVLVG